MNDASLLLANASSLKEVLELISTTALKVVKGFEKASVIHVQGSAAMRMVDNT